VTTPAALKDGRKLAIRTARRPYWMTLMWAQGTIMGSSGLPTGSEFAGFRIERKLGHGGMGIVYLAREVRLDRDVALKVIRTELAEDERFRVRFREESRIAASIEHPRVVTVFGAGERDGLLFVSMRYVPGGDLGRLISARGALPADDAASLIAEVADGLDAVHAAGLVHRDVKPANVLVAEPAPGDESPAAYLTDFGLAKLAASTSGLTATGEVIGTVDYIAPEQIEGRRVDARADVYALGCVLFHAVTGEVPFPERESSSKMWAHLNEPPPEVGSGDAARAALDPVIHRAMAKDPADRFPSAGDLGRAAMGAVRGEAVTEPEHPVGVGEAAPAADTVPLPAATAPTERQPRRRRGQPRLRRVVIPLAALLIVAALTFAALIVVPKLTDSDSPPSKSNGVTVPSLAGQPLDVAEQRLDDLGLRSTEEGGGLFGVLIASEWDVCDTSPPADSTVRPGSTVRLLIDRPDAC
jgi:serine/threonine protein kinase